jgi:hypothetical protein
MANAVLPDDTIAVVISSDSTTGDGNILGDEEKKDIDA